MCGIAGMVALEPGLPPPSQERLAQMAGALVHRGPDGFGAYRDARAGLAHARLAIVDLAGGQQPLGNADRSRWICFNGEIFNHVELRAELMALGRHFQTRSDTEVLLQAYEEWGEAAFERFNGQWAVALWDARAHRLTLARDPLGICPLYVVETKDRRVLFASEVKALFTADPSLPRAFDPVGLKETFTFWSIVPPQSVFAGVTELVPGQIRTYEKGARRDVAMPPPRFHPPRAPPAEPLEAATERVRDALRKATELRLLRADVPVGSYLSGGLDSSLVAALGREVQGERFSTFSLRFEAAEYDETSFQRTMAKALGTEHHELLVTQGDIAEAFPRAVLHTERPILRTAPVPLMLLSASVRRAGIKVVLTGEGADEMFAGYDLFREGRVRRFWARQPGSKLRPRLLERLYPYLARSPVAQRAMTQAFFAQDLARAGEPGFAHRTRWRTTSALQRLLHPDLRAKADVVDVEARLLGSLPEDFSREDPLTQDQLLELRTLLAGYLLSSQGDRMLLASSVEGRFPFLDPDVVRLAHSLPAHFKLKGLDEKHILKRAAAGRVPEEIWRRQKQPYRAPDGLCFLGPQAPTWVHDELSPEAIARAGVFAPEAVKQLHAKAQVQAQKGQLSNADNMALVGVLSTQLCHRHFIERPPASNAARLTTWHDAL